MSLELSEDYPVDQLVWLSPPLSPSNVVDDDHDGSLSTSALFECFLIDDDITETSLDERDVCLSSSCDV